METFVTTACICAVPEKIHIHPMEGHWEFLGEGVLKAKILEAKYEAKLEFPWGRGGAKPKTFHGGSKEIFWNCTIEKEYTKNVY